MEALKKTVVVSVKQSPMYAVRWCIQLACGHEEWITSRRRPKRKAMRCSICNPIGRP